MEFWKENAKLRVLLIAISFIAGVALSVVGWRMAGQLAGLGLMILGVLLLVMALWFYNLPYQTPRKKKED